jgi:hypothetical protein
VKSHTARQPIDDDARDVVHHLDGPPEIGAPTPRKTWEQPPDD